MYFYYWIGSSLETEWGAGKFTIYYLIGALLQAVFALRSRSSSSRTW